ncbi:hypothetical protein [Nocardia neocaledoniensis]|uniref:hypothetical protein n=1 Tax=Nocardia neocaledoniensis TaxID=236511 RepID=UPI0011B7360B|nr:hypothetical protein [Nocardia neocaledoniensis]
MGDVLVDGDDHTDRGGRGRETAGYRVIVLEVEFDRGAVELYVNVAEFFVPTNVVARIVVR